MGCAQPPNAAVEAEAPGGADEQRGSHDDDFAAIRVEARHHVSEVARRLRVPATGDF
jgi:hypothetical protein